ncbi:dihydropteroate synthase [Ilyomonas limi]|uniref:dihydropteroate synthase n=1 Tax=Ilyomonas limi TaxID=2575867 RepID=A0A4U3L177_9BACT|nr:dihydropteroate synthase [Ilyomonas limi]TKK67197.1 dihydropteroate synthase [Ilyomonas limi]
MFTLNCNGRLLIIDKPIVMGIINTTPDSFFAGSRKSGVDAALEQAAKMLQDGATILDIGGQSTRPGSTLISENEERDRALPVIEAIAKAFPEAFISADTFYAAVARQSIAAGATIINDVSGGTMDEGMLQTVGTLRVPYICMHIKGTPQIMQQYASYENVVKEVLDYFIQKLSACKAAGIHDIIVDPGFGFAKNNTHNFQLLKHLHTFSILQKPLLIGLSRKGTIQKTLNIPAADALNGTTVLNTIALLNGARILRVHDVKEAAEAIKLLEAYQES